MSVQVYLRQSYDRHGDELAVDRQRGDCLDLAARRGWTVTDVLVDNDTSASGKVARPGFETLLTALAGGAVTAVVAWSLDRLTRNRRDTVRLIETCAAHRVTIALVRGSDIDMATPAGRMTADILASVARHEIEQKSDRQTAAYSQSAAAGKPPAGPVPFGFTADRVTHHPEQAEAISEAYSAILAGASLAGVARDWNARGLTSGRVRTGAVGNGTPSRWSGETVRKVLTHPRNAGLRSYRGTIVGPGTWPPIVAEETYHATVALLGDPSRRVAPPSARRLLSGIAVCGVCGVPCNAGRTMPRAGYFSYRCRTAGHVARRGDDVDEYVIALVIERLSRPDAAELLHDRDKPDTEALRARELTLRARLDELGTMLADPDIPTATVRAAAATVRGELAEVTEALADAGRVSVLGPLVDADDVAQAWDGLGTDRQRAVIATLMTVTLHPPGPGARKFKPETVQIDWR
ncbi:MAG: recombinase family protein [Pseudonocardiaceae bacterium]|nr:recombinase family protein [Pseudonocardiaceae bacterium]